MSFGPFSIISAVVLSLLVLANGARAAGLAIAAAAAIIFAVQVLIAEVPFEMAARGLIGMWLTPLLLGMLLMYTRSLTLTLQLSVIIAVLAITAMFVVFDNPVDYWVEELTNIAAALNEAQQYAAAAWVEAQKPYAGQLTMGAVLVYWTLHIAAFVIGYKMYRQLPGERPEFGRFRDLNLGRVIALALAIMSIASMLTDSLWVTSVAVVLFGAFWTQGLAIVHWLYSQQMMPRVGFVAVYTMLLSFILTAVTAMGLAIFGYLDAWFNLRREPKIKLD